jgi:GNAT superfamily N-acetyltransferase
VAQSLAETLIAGQAALRSGTHAVGFAAGDDARLVSSCTLFLQRAAGCGGIGLIDEVGTLTAARGRGFARAVVWAAVQAAREWGCDEVVIPADADDWPRQLYERMGFDPIGTQVSFVLPAPPEA